MEPSKETCPTGLNHFSRLLRALHFETDDVDFDLESNDTVECLDNDDCSDGESCACSEEMEFLAQTSKPLGYLSRLSTELSKIMSTAIFAAA